MDVKTGILLSTMSLEKLSSVVQDMSKVLLPRSLGSSNLELMGRVEMP